MSTTTTLPDRLVNAMALRLYVERPLPGREMLNGKGAETLDQAAARHWRACRAEALAVVKGLGPMALEIYVDAFEGGVGIAEAQPPPRIQPVRVVPS